MRDSSKEVKDFFKVGFEEGLFEGGDDSDSYLEEITNITFEVEKVVPNLRKN